MPFNRSRSLVSAAVAATLCFVPLALRAQSDEPAIFTQTLLRADTKGNVTPTVGTTTLEINGKPASLMQRLRRSCGCRLAYRVSPPARISACRTL